MRVFGVLNWYDEEPAWLAACIASMSKLCSDVIAFDGAYGLHPGATRSSCNQAETIIRTADSLEMGWTVHAPAEKWFDGEVGKRAALLQVAARLADPSDWLLVIDADEILKDVWSGTRSQLAETEFDVAEISRLQDPWGGAGSPTRRLFRALPDITCEQTHYTVTANGRYLCGEPRVHELEPSLALLDVKIIDRGSDRSPARKAVKADYYARSTVIEQAALHA